ncbi:hypothetical protein NEHOM01_1103 [Nematocida homosporus]|uniref:uncharacterized protein n=1 Tax=Nematocida homosporus TaxID=1912981 RepID=UPI002220AF44|nr:uncharacterized protein NEHOM01_1103 [Nematocida homosporus]KAI5185826.1 hypothetical protein NEHOM01_1103 [Nematocida homosporus]
MSFFSNQQNQNSTLSSQNSGQSVSQFGQQPSQFGQQPTQFGQTQQQNPQFNQSQPQSFNQFGQNQVQTQPQSLQQTSQFGQTNTNLFGQSTQSNTSQLAQNSGLGGLSNYNNLGTNTNAWPSSTTNPTINTTGFGTNLGGNNLGGSNSNYTSTGFGNTSGLAMQPSSFNNTNTLGGNTLGGNTLGGNTNWGVTGNPIGSFGQTNTGFNTNSSFTGFHKPCSTLNAALSSNNTPNPEDVLCTIDYLEKSYDRNSQFYKFIYTFYDIIDTNGMAPMKPAHVPQDIWEQAEKQNPSPGYLTPCIVFGYEDLYARIDKQKMVIEKLKHSRKYLGDKVNELVECGTIKLTHRISNVMEKYNLLLVEVLEQIGKALGKEAEPAAIQYEQLEKRASLLSESLNAFTENISVYKRVFNVDKSDAVMSILEEQRAILLNMISTLKKRLEEK